MRPSLTARAAAGTGLAVLLLLGLGSLTLHLSLARLLRREGGQQLQRAVESVVARLDVEHEPVDPELLEDENRVLLRLTDASGGVLLETEGLSRALPPALTTPGTWAWRVVEGPRDQHFQVYAARHRAGWVLAARDLRGEARLLRGFRRILLLTWALTSLLSAALAAWLVRRGLAPVADLAREAQGIRPGALSLRLDPAAYPAELRPLAAGLNEALARLEEAFGRLATLNADMAHELRTPLHGLRLELEGLLHGALQPGQEDSLASMAEVLDHLSATLDQMLFLARAEDPATLLESRDLDVGDLLRAAAAPFESLAEEKGVGLAVEAPPGLVLKADPTLVRRALHNLLSNALRAAPAGSTVGLRGRAVAEDLRLEVVDQGSGFPPDFLPRLGERFLRPDRSRSRETGGTGLGLAIVQSIQRLHGGSLEVDRESQATVVGLRFPHAGKEN
jgi:two-component system, OmpR family, heavy metal sensor histidine kinase CusS